ncbi:MAG: isoprenylcysteine carboxylmethyltransferase family protein [Bacteroidota bacterium]|nr:isoprenylcysteine carboxylmethyltransferase family protein [Bacteroidota bacterium]
MNTSHWQLIFFWIVYYVVHSVLASTKVKIFFEEKMGRWFRYYRLTYSIFASITLILILIFQYSFQSPVLIRAELLKYFSFFFLLLPGLVIMFISIKKYFLLLSGIRSLYESTPPVELKVEGIHRFVRHPLYSGTIIFVWGLFFIFPMLNNLIAAVLLTVYVLIGINFEEKKLVKEFGKKYEEYIYRVPMLIPGAKFNK